VSFWSWWRLGYVREKESSSAKQTGICENNIPTLILSEQKQRRTPLLKFSFDHFTLQRSKLVRLTMPDGATTFSIKALCKMN
jgi:hypothetical protein